MKFQDLRSMARRIKRDGVTLWFACRDARTPWWIKLLAGLVVLSAAAAAWLTAACWLAATGTSSTLLLRSRLSLARLQAGSVS